MFFGSVPALPSCVSRDFGTCRAIVCVFKPLDAVDARARWQRDHVRRVEGAQPEQIETDPEIDEERIVALPGEHFRAVRQGVDGCRRQRLVVRRRARPIVHRRRRQAGCRAPCAAALGPGHAVGLPDVEVRIVERRDRTGVVEKRVLVLDLGLEPELVDDVVDARRRRCRC